jgi:hypothetical protein
VNHIRSLPNSKKTLSSSDFVKEFLLQSSVHLSGFDRTNQSV